MSTSLHYPLTVPIPRTDDRHVVTLLDVQHLDLPELFSRGERLFRKLAYDRASRRATEVIVISEFVRERVVERLGLDPEHVHAVWLGVDHSRFTPSADMRARAVAPLPGASLAAQEPRAPASRRSLCSGATDRSSASCSPASATTAQRCPRASRRGLGAGDGARRPVPARRAVSSSRACTRDSACRRSRRWPAAVRSPHPPRARCRRCAATPPSSSTPLDPDAIAAGIDEALAAPQSWARAGSQRAAGFTWEATARAHDAVYGELWPDGREALELRVDEQAHELLEVDAAAAQPRRSRARVGSPTRWWSSAVPRCERRVAADVVAPVEADVRRTRTRRAPRTEWLSPVATT